MGGEGIEAVGDLATGGFVARAVEPPTGEARHTRDGTCLNCATPLTGNYCQNCGQAAHVHRSLAAWWHDLAHGVLHLDGKVWRTLPLLAWRPGDLTRRYVEGERARFVSPMALFLFSVFLMFAVFSSIGGPFGPTVNGKKNASEIQAERAAVQQELANLERQRQDAAAKGADTAALDEEIADAKNAIAVINVATGEDAETGGGEFIEIEGQELGWFEAAYKKARANPALLLYKLQNNAYKFSWALIPLSVPFVALLFLFRRPRHMYDHTVFVTYSLSFMTLGTVLLSLLRVIGVSSGWIGGAILILPPFHMYRQLKGAYSLSRFGALWRTAMLLIFATIAGSLFVTTIAILGAL